MAVSSIAGEDFPQPPPSTCPICLQPIKQEAYLDRCFQRYAIQYSGSGDYAPGNPCEDLRRTIVEAKIMLREYKDSFCYQCIGEWVRYVGGKTAESMTSIKCPLCKLDNLSIVYGFNGKNFQRHYVNKDFEKRCLSDAHDFRMQFYISETELTNDMFNVEQYWRRRKYLQKNIWIQEWLIREIQTLTQDKDVDIIVHHINGVAESFFRRQGDNKATAEQTREEFRVLLSEAAQPFLAGFTVRFIDELELFLASGLNIEAYDKVCIQRIDKRLSSDKVTIDDGELYDQGHCSNYLDEDIELDT